MLSDMGMPLMDGCELSRRIKDEPCLAGIPVILLTSLARLGAVTGVEAPPLVPQHGAPAAVGAASGSAGSVDSLA